MANVYNLQIDAGATFILPIEWKDSNGTGMNLTSYTGRMQIRRTILASDFQVELTTENGGIEFVSAAVGTFRVVISPTQTATLQNGVYDLEMVSSEGQVTRLIQGDVTISKEVTR